MGLNVFLEVKEFMLVDLEDIEKYFLSFCRQIVR